MDKIELLTLVRDKLHAIGGKQADIADALGVSKSDVTRLMRREVAAAGVSLEKAIGVLRAMGVSITFVAGSCEPEKPTGRYGNKVAEGIASRQARRADVRANNASVLAGIEFDDSCPQ